MMFVPHEKPFLLAVLLLVATAALGLPAQQPSTSKPMPKQQPEAAAASTDPNFWLEEVLGDKQLDWVRARNDASSKALAQGERFGKLRDRILSILDSNDRIAYTAKRGEFYYNVWQDADNPRGLWRRTTWAEYQKDEPKWETVLDLDALGKAEGENWVWKGSTWLTPSYDRCLLSLSRGGADASVVREFDPIKKRFVEPDEGGFYLPEAKSQMAWADRDALYVGTDFGDGEEGGSMTESGYPRVVKRWQRGTKLSEAKKVAEGRKEDVYTFAYRDLTKGFENDFLFEGLTFYTNRMSVLRGGEWQRIDKQDSANASTHRQWLLLELRENWLVGGEEYAAGSLLVTNLDRYLAGERDLHVLFEPTERSSLAGWSGTKNHLLVNVLDNVRNVVHTATPTTDAGGKTTWTSEELPGLPKFGTISASPIDEEKSDDYWLTITDYLTPTSLWRGAIGDGAPKKCKSLPAFFDSKGLVVEQREAVSKDGTRVPYFLVMKDSLQRDGSNPTLLYGYGGFEVSLTPGYSATVGSCWLEEGGVYVVANIRGGGEFGPRWHQAALKQNRNKAYEDFAAVARSLIDAQITSPRHLGIQGGSNGGLLMGNMTVMYPDLFRSVVCQVPLLDMLRYHKLLAGASWMGEYGDPDVPAEAEWLRRFSPYHNVAKDVTYPKVLFTTSTRDDRVHPGHARKMMARMMEQGHDVLYYENIEGGHGGAADNKQAAFLSALSWSFLWETLP
ncbi:MAG: prolyl oligopeptidase family protein [Planctomycetota bacterium]